MRPAIFENLKFRTHEECLAYYIAKLFLDKMQLLNLKPCPIDLSNSEPIESLPLQFFLKQSTNVEAKAKFENNLNSGDLLFVEMINTEGKGLHSQELGKLRVIAKVNDIFNLEEDFVYHLNCNVYMFKNLEMTRLNRNEIKSSEVLKVCVLGKLTQQKRFVTTNYASLRLTAAERISINLGIVSYEDMPPFLKSFKKTQKFSCYSNYLRSHPHFYHNSDFKKQIESLGIDPYRIYSFCSTRDGLSVPPGRSTDSLINNAKEAIHIDAQNHLEEAKKFAEKFEIHTAIEEFEKSASCWPENYKLYELRGKMYLGMCKGRKRRGSLLFKAVADFETALHLNPSAQESKQCLSKIFLYRSKGLLKRKELENSKRAASTALKILPENIEAAEMLKKIEMHKKPCYIVDEDSVDLQTLERQKMLIKQKLKKERVS
ncbi:uncharacterized protein [Parasteatoda tepidariorum]|nr:uncharacterized protein LOC107446007 isoform X2 [Parasteatoda tepidariorum]